MPLMCDLGLYGGAGIGGWQPNPDDPQISK